MAVKVENQKSAVSIKLLRTREKLCEFQEALSHFLVDGASAKEAPDSRYPGGSLPGVIGLLTCMRFILMRSR